MKFVFEEILEFLQFRSSSFHIADSGNKFNVESKEARKNVRIKLLKMSIK